MFNLLPYMRGTCFECKANSQYYSLARGGIEPKHSTEDKSPPPPPPVCMTIHLYWKVNQHAQILVRVLVLNDPPA